MDPSRRSLVFGLVLTAVLLGHADPGHGMTHEWSQRFGSGGGDRGLAVVTDAAGNVVMTGLFEDTVNFGGAALTSAGSTDMFLAKYDSDGGHLWSRRYGSGGIDWGNTIAVDAAGDLLVGGTFEGTVSFGGDSYSSAGSADLFVAKYDPTGAHLWSHAFGAGGLDRCHSIAVDGDGNVLVTGTFEGSVPFGVVPLVSGGFRDIYIAKFDGDGRHLWSRSFGGSGEDRGLGIAADADGNVFVTGYYEGAVSLGGDPLPDSGSPDVFLAKYDPDGNHLWSRGFGDDATDNGLSVAVDGADNVIVTGHFEGAVDFGGGPLVSAGGWDVFLAKYDPSGAHLWSHRFGDSGDDRGNFVTVGDANTVFATGYFQGVVGFGGDTFTSAGGQDEFLLRMAADGTHAWSRHYGGTGDDQGRCIDVDAAGSLLVTGFFVDAVSFGGGLLPSAGARDAFLAKYDPQAAIQGTKWSDDDCNGQRDLGEPGLADWEIRLYQDDTLLRTTLTDANGDYEFQNLLPGWYRVVEVVGSNWVQTFPHTVSHRVEIIGSETLEGLDFGNNRCEEVHRCTGACLAGVVDDFDPSNGDELTTVTPQFQSILETCSDHSPRLEFDQVLGNRCFGQSFSATCATCWAVDGCVSGGQLTFRATPASTQGNDVVTLREDGEIVWWASLNDLQYAATADPTWDAGDTTTFHLDLADLPSWQGVTNVLATLQDGDLDFMVSNDTGVDFVELVIEKCRGDDDTSADSPGASRLWARAYPNPSNPATVIEFELPRPGMTTLVLYDLQGRRVVTLLREFLTADVHRATWDGRDGGGQILAAGVYVYRLESSGRSATGKVMLLK